MTASDAPGAIDVVNGYYAACNHGGDLSEVPLAEDVRFSGPLGSVEGAEGLRAHTAKRGYMRCTVRDQFVDGSRVCSIVDWELSWPVSSLMTNEIIEVLDTREEASAGLPPGSPALRP